jgi:hypothetical protein
VLVQNGEIGLPWGETIRRGSRPGTVVVSGGFRTRAGLWLRRGVTFRFQATRAGAELSLPVQGGDTLRVQDFVPVGSARLGNHGRRLATRRLRSVISVPPQRVAGGAAELASAYAARLRGIQRFVTIDRPRTLRWRIETAPQLAP